MSKNQRPKQPAKPFEDLHSDSGGGPRRPDFIQNRLNEEWDLPQWERPRDGPAPETDPPVRDRALPRKPVRKRSKKSHRGAVGLLIGVMVAAAGLTVLFLGFKVRDIEVSGTLPEGVTIQQVIDASGIQLDVNLVLLSDKEAREQIPLVLPGIEEVRLHKHLPDRVELEILPATVGAAVSWGDQWLEVSDKGKILAQTGQPGAEDLKVLAPLPTESAPGQQLAFEDSGVRDALVTVLQVLPQARSDSGLTGTFTLLDLRDVNKLALYYRDQVRLELGSAWELEYKLRAGCRFLADPTAAQTGVLDLTSTPDTKRAVMASGTVELPTMPGQIPAPTPSPTPDPSATPNPRDKDIPTTIYTGEPTPAPSQAPEDDSSDQDDSGGDDGEGSGQEEDDWSGEESDWESDAEPETGDGEEGREE